jgi:hypothetical protein
MSDREYPLSFVISCIVLLLWVFTRFSWGWGKVCFVKHSYFFMGQAEEIRIWKQGLIKCNLCVNGKLYDAYAMGLVVD